MRLAIATIFYNAKAELERLVKSIPNNSVDCCIWIDGIFKYTKEQNPELSDLSNDDSIFSILGDMSNKPRIFNIYEYDSNFTEFNKRNHYLEICKVYDIDYLIIVDSDEFFVYPEGVTAERSWQLFRRNFEMLARKNSFQHNVFSIRSLDIATNTESHRPRCWYNPGDMSYVNLSHYHYGNIHNKTEFDKIQTAREQRLNYCQESRGVIKGITLAHSHDLRTKEQLQLREQYQRYLVKYESLVQNGYSHEKAHKIAKANPSKEFNPT